MGFQQNLHADVSGANLHIAVRCGADARQALKACTELLAPLKTSHSILRGSKVR